jgi:hypothetical protein
MHISGFEEFSISMSEVGSQGDPCTASILLSIVRPHLLYSSSSTVPLTKYSILHNGISLYSLCSIKNVYLSDKMLIQLKPSPFSCIFLVVHISSQEQRN